MDKETAKDQSTSFLKEIGQRFANPLFYSYLIAWLIFNWEIPSAILFDKLPHLGNGLYSSYTSFIYKTIALKGFSMWLCPLIYAIGYVIISPLIREGITNLNVYISKYSYRLTKKLSEGSYIPTEEFFKLKESYDEQTKRIEKLYETEFKKLGEFSNLQADHLSLQTTATQLQIDNNSLESQKESLNQQLAITKTENTRTKEIYDPKRLSGLWVIYDNKTNEVSYMYFEKNAVLEFQEDRKANKYFTPGILLHFKLVDPATLSFVVSWKPESHNSATENSVINLIPTINQDVVNFYTNAFEKNKRWERTNREDIEQEMKTELYTHMTP